VALLIGVSEYGEGIPSLSAPLYDVTEMERVLKKPEMGGFDEVKTLINPDLVAMQKSIQQIFQDTVKDDLVLLFFSGHGVTDDENKLYLTTKATSKNYYQATSVSASFVQDISKNSRAKRQIIVLDCCYSGAFAQGWQAKSLGLDLKKELGAEGRVVLTSSTATQTSFQQEDAKLSLYTQYLVEGIETGAADKDCDGKIYVRDLHDYAKGKVKEARPTQKPEIIIIDQEGYDILLSYTRINNPELLYRRLVEKYSTNGQISVAGKEILIVKRQEYQINDEKSDEIINEVLAPYRKRIEKIGQYKKVFEATVEQEYPLNGERLLNELQDLQNVLGLEDKDVEKVKQQILAEKEVKYQQKQKDKQEAESRQQQLEQRKPFTEKLPNSIELEMISIPAGSFMMGSTEEEIEQLNKSGKTDRFNREKPQHQVTISQPFYIGKYPVTQEQYEAVMGNNPSNFKKGGKYPVETVSWDDAQAFCQKLSKLTGKTYRLPSESEWEYACRAGTQTRYYFGDNENQLKEYAWYDANSNKQTQPVGQKKPNNWGLYDMLGNVWEWCEDDWCESYNGAPKDGGARIYNYNYDRSYPTRTMRGGSWLDESSYFHCANRCHCPPTARDNNKSFRVVQEVKDKVINEVELKRERGIDYTPLRDLLAAGKWKEADLETGKVICKAANRTKEEWLRIQDIQALPWADLNIIDQLWRHYSKDKFGFSVQLTKFSYEKKTCNKDIQAWEEFSHQVHWQKYYKYFSKTNELTYEDISPYQLPSILLVVGEKALKITNFHWQLEYIKKGNPDSNYIEDLLSWNLRKFVLFTVFNQLMRRFETKR